MTESASTRKEAAQSCPFGQMTPEQRAAALARGVELRAARKKVKEDVAAGRASVAEVLARKDDPVCGGMRVEQLLRAQSGWGKATAERAMAQAGVMPNRKVKALPARQAEELVKLTQEEAQR